MGLLAQLGYNVPPGWADVTDLLAQQYWDGTTEASDAWIAMAIAARDSYTSVAYPPGITIKVNKTIHACRNDVNNWDYPGQNASAATGGQVLVHMGVPIPGMVPPKILLMDSVYTNTADPKPVVHLYRAGTDGDESYPPLPASPIANREDPENFYRGVWSGITIDCGNNPGACGLLFYAAQESVCTDVEVTGDSFFVGFSGIPGHGGTVRNLKVTHRPGGSFQYGIRTYSYHLGTASSLGLSISNLTIIGSTVQAVRNVSARGCMSIFGAYIKPASGDAVGQIGSNLGEYGNTALFDSAIDMPLDNDTAIEAQWSSTSIFNCWIRRASIIANHDGTTRDFSGNGTGWYYVERYKGGAATADSGAGTAKYFVKDHTIVTPPMVSPVNKVGSASGPDITALQRQHEYRMPNIFGSNVIVATATTSTAPCFNNNTTDNGTRLQDKVNEARTTGKILYIPLGQYLVSQTLNLQDGDVIVGAPGSVARMIATTAWRAAVNAGGVEVFYIDTAADAKSKLTAHGLVCDCTSNYTGPLNQESWLCFMRWRAGRYSVSAECFGNARPYSRFDKPVTWLQYDGPTAGGRHWATWGNATLLSFDPENDPKTQFSTSFRFMSIKNTREPLTIYGQDIEYGGTPSFVPNHAALLLIQNSRRVRIGSIKHESWKDAVEIIDSDVTIGICGFFCTYDAQLDPSGSGIIVNAASNLDVGHVAFATTTGTYPADYATTYLVKEVPQVTSLIHRGQCIGGYEQGTLQSVTGWDHVPIAYQPSDLFDGRRSAMPVFGSGYDPATLAYLRRIEATAGASVSPHVLRALDRLFRRARRAGVLETLTALQLFCTDSFTGVLLNQYGSPDPVLVGLGSGQYTLAAGFTKTVKASNRVNTQYTAPDNTPWGWGAILDVGTPAASFCPGGCQATGVASYRISTSFGNQNIVHEFGASGATFSTGVGTGIAKRIFSHHRYSTTSHIGTHDAAYAGQDVGTRTYPTVTPILMIGANMLDAAEQLPLDVGAKIQGYFITNSLASRQTNSALQGFLLSFLRDIGRY